MEFERIEIMGYESKLFVVNKPKCVSVDVETKKKYAEVIAKFDMGCIPNASSKMRKYPVTDSFVFGDDGNTPILEDRYDKELTEIPLDDAIEILVKDWSENINYRRLYPVIAFLKAIDKKNWDEVVILHYGY